MTVKQLRLLQEQPLNAQAADPVERLFAHWVFMLGKNPKRCALGPGRRRVISAALALYDVETLELAIEGCASSPHNNGVNDRGTPYNDLELIYRSESHVERFAALGERVRDAAEAAAARAVAAQAAPPPPVPDEARALAARQRVREQAAAMRRAG